MTRALPVFLFLAACAAGTGNVVVEASGEEAAVEGYPTSTGIAFADGWSLTVDRVLVSVEGFALTSGATTASAPTDHVIVNLHDALRQPVWMVPMVGAHRWSVGYHLVPATADARLVGTVRPADLTEMTTGHWGFLLDGTAHHPTHGDVALHLGIPLHVDLSRCENYVDMTDGLVVRGSGTTDVDVTFHLDHLFFDSTIAPAPHVRFEPYAAAAGTDGVVTYDDLASQRITDLRDTTGAPLLDDAGHRVAYDYGSEILATPTLQSYVYLQATTIGHFNGEGHCEYSPVP